jgi:predicted benzoate:H+ symporter BenE
MANPKGGRFIFTPRELGGAFGDLGTLLPLMLGAIAVAGSPPTAVIGGFAVFYIATGLYYRLPIPVQPMKAVAAVLLAAGIAPASLAFSGVVIGLVLLILGVTGWITHLARIVPQSVLAGLQLGLGLTLALVSLDLMATAPLLGAVILALLIGLLLRPRMPSALIALAIAVAFGQLFDMPGISAKLPAEAAFLAPALPSLAEAERAVSQIVLPQLSLTFTNAVLLTALIASDYFGDRAAHVTPARLSVTSGLANLLMTPFGALPMCHGAGGLAAHYRFGARSGTAPLILGLILLALAAMPSAASVAALGAVPAAGLGALLMVAAGELAISKRLYDSKPSCWPVIAVTAGATVWVDPFWGLLAGSGAELLRVAVLRVLQRNVTTPR